MKCKKCNGEGSYMYSHNHGKICEYCCTHDKGWWELTEDFSGYEEGGNNNCCRKGCGMMQRDVIEELKNKI